MRSSPRLITTAAASLLALLGAASALATPNQDPAQDLPAFCSLFHKELALSKSGANDDKEITSGKLLKEVVRLTYAPQTAAPLKALRQQTRPERLVAPRGRLKARNIIFSIEAPRGMTESVEFKNKEREVEAAQKKLADIRDRIIAPLRETRDENECVAVASRLDFDLAELNQALATLQDNWQIKQVKEAEVARKQLETAKQGLSLDWEIVPFTHLFDVQETLKSGDVENAVIISHSGEDGTLVDGERNTYPSGFFADLSPAVRTLTIFGCHGVRFPKHYGLKRLLADTPTLHREREIYYTQGTTLFGTPELAPVLVVPSFLHRVEARILELRAKAKSDAALPMVSLLAPKDERLARCSLHVPGFEVKSGSYAWILNGRTVGISRAGGRQQRFHFPCSFLDRPSNVLVNRNIAWNLDDAEARAPKDIFVQVPAEFTRGAPRAANLKHFARKVGTPFAGTDYRSSKVLFEWNPESVGR